MMFERSRRVLSSAVGLLLAAVLLPLGTPTIAHAAISGPKIFSAAGETTDGMGDPGYIAMGGLVVLNRKGGARSLNITLSYEDQYSGDFFSCTLSNPSDLTYSITKGVGTLTLTVGPGELCNLYTAYDNAGNSITFQIYAAGSKVRMVSIGSTLVDSNYDSFVNLAISGEMNPSGMGGRQASGKRLVAGGGGAVDSGTATNIGYMAMAGKMSLKRQKPGDPSETAKMLDLMLTFESTDSTNFSCYFTDPSDVSYTLKKGVGTLMLKVGSNDTCGDQSGSVPNVGNWISFNLYAAGAKGLIVSTGSTLVDGNKDTIVPAVTADFSSAGGLR